MTLFEVYLDVFEEALEQYTLLYVKGITLAIPLARQTAPGRHRPWASDRTKGTPIRPGELTSLMSSPITSRSSSSRLFSHSRAACDPVSERKNGWQAFEARIHRGKHPYQF